ncbi:MAG: TrkH family potassium uptake protein [Candidatus Marinimicrobia bacterium]|nr:TrkH family potassium uptake protein [Candidatus Neomarinimicrobiota bacterium]
MRIRHVITLLGTLFIVLGIILSVPLFISILNKDSQYFAFIIPIIVTVTVGFLLQFNRPEQILIEKKEAVAIIVFGWISVSLIGALPLYISGYFASFLDAFFESVSGFTTTGASVLNNIEALPASILIWRSMTHWIGGMGIVILALVVLPAINVGSRNLYNFESSSIANEQITPKIKDTARLLWFVYLFLTVAETLLLLVGGLSFFDASLIAMATIPTGGFSPCNASIAAYGSSYVEAIVILFMVLSGINFSLYLTFFKSNKSVRQFSEIVKFYLILMTGAALIVVLDLRLHCYDTWTEAIRYGVFQVVSINTTTGFVTANYEHWRPLSQVVLLILMFIGACPGSTTGAIKNSRIIILIKSIYRELIQMIHPRIVASVRLNNKVIDNRTIKTVLVFIGMYLTFFFVATLLMTVSGTDIITSVFSVATTLGGVGPGLGLTGPAESYALLSSFNKIVLIACMLFGRLEFYSLFLIFIPKFWRRA